ncbi:MAG: shikimate dehydrogenase [Mariprofundus sp.]|nr:shikimate dehydrogenase [Mariprofundus sp.]
MNITGTTKIYGIIGWPVSHSISPLFQATFIEEAAMNAVYLPFSVQPEQLKTALDGLMALGVEGFNVTVPHKEAVFDVLECDSDAVAIGAVNSVRRDDRGWQASNTDWLGFRSVVEGLSLALEGEDVLLFGAGGTARAVIHAMASLQVGRLFICNRNPQRRDLLLEHARKTYPNLLCLPLLWEEDAVMQTAKTAKLLVNSTTIGLNPKQSFPFPLSGRGAAIDAVYSVDGQTAFCQAAIAAGRVAVDGLPMLVAQGAASFAWWHDCDQPDCSKTLRAIEQQLGREPIKLPGWFVS